MPQMDDPNFARTVVLLCDYTDKGAFGLIVNRQMDEPAWSLIRPDAGIRVNPELHLWVGGPVDPERTWVLMAGAQGPDDDNPGGGARCAAVGLRRAARTVDPDEEFRKYSLPLCRAGVYHVRQVHRLCLEGLPRRAPSRS